MGFRQSSPRGPLHRSFVVLDIASYGRLDDRTQLHARAALNALVRKAFRAAGMPWWRFSVEGRGDGMIVFVPPAVSKADLLDPLVPLLLSGLRAHNARHARIRLRMSVHAGEVLRARRGWVGADLNTACRLVDSPALYQQLERFPDADLVLIVSDAVHRGVVRHGYRGVRPQDYAPVHVSIKEVDERAWVHVPGHRTTSLAVPRPSSTASSAGS